MHSVELLYNSYHKDIYAYLCSLTHDPQLSEDLLQETFVKALASLPAFEGRSSVKTWLFGIARNLWLQSLRRSQRDSGLIDKLSAYLGDTATVESATLNAHAAQRVYSFLAQKQPRVQQIVRMRLDGYSFYEISLALGISENSARVADFRARRWIQSMLEKEGLD